MGGGVCSVGAGAASGATWGWTVGTSNTSSVAGPLRRFLRGTVRGRHRAVLGPRQPRARRRLGQVDVLGQEVARGRGVEPVVEAVLATPLVTAGGDGGDLQRARQEHRGARVVPALAAL